MTDKPIDQIGQAPNSNDCGFFAGHMLSLWEQYGPRYYSIKTSEEAVYRSRNRYRAAIGGRRDPETLPLTPDLHSIGLYPPSTMIDYLKSLGVRGYKARAANEDVPVAGLYDQDKIRQILRSHLPPSPGNVGLLLAVYPLHQGHWFLILARNSPGSASTKPVTRPLLKWGSRGAEVELLQQTLNTLNPTALARLVPDGIFGKNTYARVQEYQRNAGGLVPDGVVGPKTWGRLEAHIGAGVAPDRETTYVFYDSGRSQAPYVIAVKEDRFVEVLAKCPVTYVVWRHEE